MNWQQIAAALVLTVTLSQPVANAQVQVPDVGSENQAISTNFGEVGEANITTEPEAPRAPSPRSRDQLLLYVLAAVVVLGALASKSNGGKNARQAKATNVTKTYDGDLQ